MFDPKADQPVDPEMEEIVRKNLLGPASTEAKQVPSTFPERRRFRRDPIDKALAGWSGIVKVPYNPKPRLVKRNFAKP